jgi:mRNA interferase RelE/StbE
MTQAHKVEIKKSALKEIEKLENSAASQIVSKIDALTNNPRPPQSLKLSGSERSYRLRIGRYRILYQIDEAVKLVTVYAVGHRKDIYR